MKKSAALILTLLLLLSACSGGVVPAEETDTVEVVVFAAASLEAALTQIAEQYKAVAPEVALQFNFDSSGTLRTQIKEGAACDLFLSAGQAQMDDLDGEKNGGMGFLCEGTRIDLLENKVVLAAPEGNPAGLASFRDLAGDGFSLLCIGNEDVPVGAYSLEILDSLGVDVGRLESEGRVTYASNVTEVARQVQEAAVDCGILYATDASTYGLTVVDRAEEGMCSPAVYPAAVLDCGTPGGREAARAFLDYLRTGEEAAAILEDVGFTVLK